MDPSRVRREGLEGRQGDAGPRFVGFGASLSPLHPGALLWVDPRPGAGRAAVGGCPGPPGGPRRSSAGAGSASPWALGSVFGKVRSSVW